MGEVGTEGGAWGRWVRGGGGWGEHFLQVKLAGPPTATEDDQNIFQNQTFSLNSPKEFPVVKTPSGNLHPKITFLLRV